MDRSAPTQESTMAKCTRKKKVYSPAAHKTVTRCAAFSGAKRKSRKSRKSRK